ncbi:MAG: GNAT family N-acetyltransferase [Rhodospirillales bacterium]|nr:GNAT family N-acetyltransferase [Rhodospirillales bacterium]
MVRDGTAEPPVFEHLRSGSLAIRLADNPAAVAAAQTLRYRVFYDEMGARPSDGMLAEGRDFDQYDEVCDHLLVVDTDLPGPGVVGTYRLMRREAVAKVGRFYTAGEYDIAPLLAYPGEVLELGRSCVDAKYRSGLTMQLMWRGIMAYIFHYKLDVMFGCASLPGTQPQDLALSLSYLHHHHLAPEILRPRALPGLYTDMRLLPAEQVDVKRALAELPPLVKGYLRVGAYVGDGAVVDRQFNTTDVCIIVKTDRMTGKYARHYDRTARLG